MYVQGVWMMGGIQDRGEREREGAVRRRWVGEGGEGALHMTVQLHPCAGGAYGSSFLPN